MSLGFPCGSAGKESACNAEDLGLISGLGRFPWRRERLPTPVFLGFSCGSAGKESACSAGDLGSIPGLGRSPEEGKGYLLQFSGLENSMDRIVISSVAHLCPTLCNPLDCSTPGFPIHHQLLEPAQTHVLKIGHAMQPSHPLSSPSPPTFNLSQHQGLFKRDSSLHQWPNIGVSTSASVLRMNIQD